MTHCRTLDDIRAAADADSVGEPPLTQDQADLIAAILAPYRATPRAGAASPQEGMGPG